MRALLFVALVALPACFQVSEPVCSYSCGPAPELACPHDYTCQADNYCHRKGQELTACEFTDAATLDEAVPFDLLSSTDGAPTDGGSPDAAPDL